MDNMIKVMNRWSTFGNIFKYLMLALGIVPNTVGRQTPRQQQIRFRKGSWILQFQRGISHKCITRPDIMSQNEYQILVVGNKMKIYQDMESKIPRKQSSLHRKTLVRAR